MKTPLFLACLITGAPVLAFPPVPYYTLHGQVRDQTGRLLTAEDAQVLLLRNGKELSRTPIKSFVDVEQNYELNVRLDQTAPGTALYNAAAIAAQGTFSIAVEMGGQRYYPIEVSGNLTAGKGAERVKLDLTLGEDTDGDELPDVWEIWQLFQAGRTPGASGWDLALLSKAGDFDGDGQSDYLEYLAGTFAGDASQSFRMEIKEKAGERVKLEFFGITGKLYTIERSTDNITWARVPFSTGAAAAAAGPSFTAGDVGTVTAWAEAGAGDKQFYRLSVQ